MNGGSSTVRACDHLRFFVSTQWWFSVTGTVSGRPCPSSRGSARRAPWDRSPRPTGYARRPRCPFRGRRPKFRGPSSAASCFRRIAAASPATPAPTMTTSYSIDSRSLIRFLSSRARRRSGLACPANSLTAPSTLDDRRRDGWGNDKRLDRSRGGQRCSAGGWKRASTSPVGETPRDWLRSIAAPRPLPPRRSPKRRARRPRDLAALPRLARAPSPACRWTGPARGGSCPHGAEAAPLMLLADFPAREDAAEGRPIGGEAWVLAQRCSPRSASRPTRPIIASLACFHAPGAEARRRRARALRRHRPRPYPPRQARAPAPVRRRPGARAARRAAGRGARPGSPDRRGPHGRHLPPALAAAAAVGQGARLARPVTVDERRGLMRAHPVDPAGAADRRARPSRSDPLAPLAPPSTSGAQRRQPARSPTVAQPPHAAAAPAAASSRATGAACSPRSAPATGTAPRPGIATLPDGPLKPVAQAELFTAEGFAARRARPDPRAARRSARAAPGRAARSAWR